MKSVKSRILLTALLTTLGVLVAPGEALAVVQSLNGQTGQTQTFQNDTNVTISSSSNTHSLGWQGFLSLSRGGTGASSFTSGSLLFSNGSSISEDNSSLFWDDTNNRLGIGTSSPTSTLDVFGDTSISGDLYLEGNLAGRGATTNNTNGNELFINAGGGLGSGAGGSLSLDGGGGGETGDGGPIYLRGGNGGSTSGNGGDIQFVGGNPQGGNSNAGGFGFSGSSGSGSGRGSIISVLAGSGGPTGNGGWMTFYGGNGGIVSGDGGSFFFSAGSAQGGNSNGGDIVFSAGGKSGSGTQGTFRFSGGGGGNAVLNTSSVASPDKTFTFPNASGTFGLLEANQTWNGLNKFEANTNSTIYIGSSVKSGCIAMGDSDSDGITYVTANDGVLTASTTKPSICQ